MNPVRHLIAAAAFALAGGATLAAPAQADSPVQPPHSFDFVVDNGVCAFPVEYSGTTRDLALDTPHGFITMTPNWRVTMTNTITGASWSPPGNGAITYSETDDGTFTVTSTGVSSDPGAELLLIGSWSRSFTPDGGDTGWVGHGQQIDVCRQLS
jgi:hypothetical protein